AGVPTGPAGPSRLARECTGDGQRQVFLATVAEAAPALERARRPKSRARLLSGMKTPSIPAGRAARSPAARPAAGASCHGHQELTEQRRGAKARGARRK